MTKLRGVAHLGTSGGGWTESKKLIDNARDFAGVMDLGGRSSERLHSFVMDRQNIPGTSPYEPVIGFSRAVRIGKVVHVSGTGPVGADDLSPAEQTRVVLKLIEAALLQAGAKFEHVYRTRMFIAHQEDWEDIGRAHGEVFAEIRPAATMVVASLLNPKWRVEIEAEALLP